MKNLLLILSCVLLTSAPALAQTEVRRGVGAGIGAPQTGDKPSTAAQAKLILPPEQPGSSRFVQTLTNVLVELILTDQVATAAPEKKTVSMIVASGNWGKIRSSGTYRPSGEPALVAELNVDARPNVSTDGAIQLELTVLYNPPGAAKIEREDGKARPSGINQSQTIVLQSGKALIISQAADPVSDRKVVVEVKATVLK